jgi:hypothetical protein
MEITGYFYRLYPAKSLLPYTAATLFQESPLKLSLLALTIALVSSLAHADLAQEHQKECETAEVKSLMGTTGSCRIVVAPKRIEKQGYCVGTFMGSLPCVVSYISVKAGAAMNLTCGTNAKAPVIDQDMGMEALGYNLALMIKKFNSQDVIHNDRNDYSLFSNSMVNMLVIESSEAGVPVQTGAISINLQTGPVSLSNVKCN